MSITIALDGYSSCGKSTLARALAAALGYVYVDSGAMYRAVTLHFLRNAIDIGDPAQVRESLAQLSLDLIYVADGQRVRLNGELVDEELRTMEVSALVSPVATLSPVRADLVARQQQLGQRGGIVMDGRDIGTVVFPKAELKLFVTARPEARVERRYLELLAMGQEVDRVTVRANLETRDHIDSTRADSPLRQAADAVLIDNSVLSREEQLAMVVALARIRERRGR